MGLVHPSQTSPKDSFATRGILDPAGDALHSSYGPDITSARPGKRQAALQSISHLQERIMALRAEDAIQPPLPTGIGNVIMTHFGLPPSRQIGDLKKELERLVESGELESRREAEYYLAHVAKMLGRETT